MSCRICLDDGGITPCDCAGTQAYVHEKCLLKWIQMSGRTECEICHAKYQLATRCACRPLFCARQLCVMSAEKRTHSVLTSYVIVMAFLFACIMPHANEWIMSISIIAALQFLFVGILVIAKCTFYPFQTLGAFVICQSVAVLVVYGVRRDDFFKTCAYYCDACNEHCGYKIKMNDWLHKMWLGVTVQICVTACVTVAALISIMIRSCKRIYIKSQEKHALMAYMDRSLL